MRRQLIPAAAALACAGPWAAAAQDLCARLAIPAQLGLSCGPAAEPDAVEVAPSSGTFAALSRMTVRPLERDGADAAAWTDPAGWMRAQATPDTSGLAGALGGLAADPDSPFAGGQATAALEALERALAGVSALALAACGVPAPEGTGDGWQMRCDYASEGLGVFVILRLVASGERRWAISMRAANEQRLRHFEAIANSFQPPPPG